MTAIKFQRDVAADYPMLISIVGPPGAGKTYSALTIAQGIKAVRSGDILLIDTEAGRAAKYRQHFDFLRYDMQPPFSPGHFLSAIQEAVKMNPACIVIDSMSDEHVGKGGVLEMHDAELDRMAGNDWAKRDRMAQAAWIKPKLARKEAMRDLAQIKIPMIFTFRAEEKTKPIKDDRGRVTPTNIGYQPLVGSGIMGWMDLAILLPPKSDGVPIWKSEKLGEEFLVKLPQQFKGMFREGAPITQDTGKALALWARGSGPQAAETSPPPPIPPDLWETATARAESGAEAFRAWWKDDTTADERAALKPRLPELQAMTEKAAQ